jgi:hypothetical protein
VKLVSDFLPLAAFTRDALDSTVDKDPINLVFVGELARATSVRRLVVDVLGCWADKLISDQYFYEPLSPVTAHRQDFNQTDSWFSGITGRVHTRIYQVFSEDPRIGAFVAAPIHLDKISWCGDAADSFDLARDWAVRALVAAGHAGTYLSLHPPQTVRQCDGRHTPWDGRTAVVGDTRFLAERHLGTFA